jgi:excisionase family DNA binding protein
VHQIHAAPDPTPLAEKLHRLGDVLRGLAEIAHLEAEREGRAADADPMLTVSEAAAELKLSPAHIRNQCRSGAITAMRDGTVYRIRLSALRAYERRRTGK